MPDKLDQYRHKSRQRVLLLLTLAAMALFIVAALMHVGAGDAEWAGMSVSNTTPARMMEFNIPKEEQGVVVNWAEDPAYSSGVRGGDLLKAINNKPIKNLSDFLKTARGANLEQGVLLDMLRNGQPLYITMENKLGFHDSFKKALNLDLKTSDVANISEGMTPAVPAGRQAAFANRSPAETAEAGAINGGQNDPKLILPSPKEQGAAHKELIEGHWLGMELIPLTPELAKEYQVPVDSKGLLVDEISLEAAESGILAGDVVLAVNGIATPDIAAFTEATRRVKNRYKATILVSRRGQLLECIFSSTRTLGFSQNEAAQPITPNAISPHRNRNMPCTACHIIMITGGQLPTDAGDILPNPPPITKGAISPHEYRGKCNTCHIILKKQ